MKIDVQFIQDLIENPQNQHVVKAIVNLAQGFERKTIAEGVETLATLDLLEDYGVDYAQGYAIGRPAPVEAVLSGLAAGTESAQDAADGLHAGH